MKIPTSKIKADSEFNCRGEFLLQDVRDLATQIKEHGLLQPVVVRPCGDHYQLLAGFRRFAAVSQLLGWAEIEAKVVHVNDAQARTINLIENLERENLNPLQEARAMEHLYPESRFGCRDVAQALKRNTQWVLLRRDLLKLPVEIQKMVASGRIPISRVGTIKHAPDQMAAAKQLLKRKHPRQPLPGLRRRSKSEVRQMIARLMDAGLDGLTTRVLAWVNGYVSDEEINHDIDQLIATGRETSAQTSVHK